ncbi:MAG: hypothetical protein LBR53_02065 [Deltaproteobacteria bacterium]|jgi:uncharacterized OB-fold protein|nr:hypothetical protein [Deltaproteobacteria bacterium]
MPVRGIDCPKCGAPDAELVPAARPGKTGVLQWILRRFQESARAGRPPMGRYILRCRKCGHESVVIMN